MATRKRLRKKTTGPKDETKQARPEDLKYVPPTPVEEAEQAKSIAPAPAPTQERCRDSQEVRAGDLVRFWLPMNGAMDRLIEAQVYAVHAAEDDDAHPAIDIEYQTQSGRQTREGCAYCLPGDRRTGRWVEFTPIPEAAPEPAGQPAE
jgi:hypothetical protein